MNTVAVVPVKSLREAKSRLADYLSPQERATLAFDMLGHVLHAIVASGAVSRIVVISPDLNLPGLPPGVALLQQTRVGLNNLLEQGREWASDEGADALLVAFADLLLLSPGEILDIADMGEPQNTVVLAPDRHGHGTNILLAHPASLARFAFGHDSFSRHQALAHAAGARVEVYWSPGTALDIDTPADLECLERERVAVMEY